MKKPIIFVLILGVWFYAAYTGIPVLKTALTIFIIFLSLKIWTIIKNLLNLILIIKYSGVDEVDFLKQRTSAGQAELLTNKLMEKALLLNYKSIRAVDKLQKINYLPKYICEAEKQKIRFVMEKTTVDYIIIPEINPNLLYDLSFFAPDLFTEFKEISLEQKLQIRLLSVVMPKVFGYKPR